jgi:hypothetical protein
MGWDPSQDHSFFPVSSFRFRQGPTNFFTGPDLSGPLPRSRRRVRTRWSRSGRRDPQYDSGARAQPRCRWPLETAQRHLSSRPELCQEAPILDLYKRIREGRCWASMIPSFCIDQKTRIPPAAGNRRRSRRRPSARRALSRSTFAELLGLLSCLACPSRPGLQSLLRPERHGSVQIRLQCHEPHVFGITNHDSAHRHHKSRPAVPNRILTQTPVDARVWRHNEAMTPRDPQDRTMERLGLYWNWNWSPG